MEWRRFQGACGSVYVLILGTNSRELDCFWRGFLASNATAGNKQQEAVVQHQEHNHVPSECFTLLGSFFILHYHLFFNWSSTSSETLNALLQMRVNTT